jgi:hypothetical protein
MAELKTKATEIDPTVFLNAIPDPKRREDGLRLDRIFREVTGWAPKMWGPTIVGYGRYDYKYDSGRTGSMCATGFSPRKANLVCYIMPGYTDFSAILSRLGKHKLAKSCLYLNRLPDVDESALRDLIRAGLDDLATRYPVSPA